MSTTDTTAAQASETREFQTEARQLLDLMIHSVYSHPEIFLRELISNASDAIDKLRFESLTNPDLAKYAAEPEIRIDVDANARTLTISDNGIGMSRDEIVRYIGTIAKSGTKEYVRALQESRAKGGDGAGADPELIGQFGVGFYSAFMVADRVELLTRRAGEDAATRWESRGDGTYTLEPAQRDQPGTTITLHLKDAAAEGGVSDDADDDETPLSASRRGSAQQDFTSEWTVRDVVRRYSDFVAYPIRMKTERTEVERDDEGKPKEGAEPRKVIEDDTLNSMKAIWTRPASEVTDEEYKEFYRHISHDWSEPLERITMKVEGTTEFRALLFIPSRAPFDLFTRAADDPGSRSGVHLYVKRIFIMADARELIPEWLRFIRGVVDSEDLSLNISREILQKDRRVAAIRKAIVRKIIDTLRTMARDKRDEYLKFWNEFGRVVKEGLVTDSANKEAIVEICLFSSTASGRAGILPASDGDDTKESSQTSSLTTLEEYISRMKDGQQAIYYLTGPSLEAAAASPHLEAFRSRGIEVLLLADPVDEVWLQNTFEVKGKRMQSAAKGSADLGTEEERKKADEELKEKETGYRDLMNALKEKLSDRIKDVRLSNRLTESPACLVGDVYDMTPQMEAMMRAMGQAPPPSKRILELNPGHPIVEKLKASYESDKASDVVADYADLLYGQALLAEGTPLPDPAAFSRKLADLMTRAIG